MRRGRWIGEAETEGLRSPSHSFLLLAQNLQAVALQESGVFGVVEDGVRLGVLGAVQFDHEADAGTVKIYTGKRH